MHPYLKFDLLGEQIDAASEIGVSNHIYISGGFDERLARMHPDWLVRKRDESMVWCRDFSHPGFHRIYMNSPYLEILASQVTEVCSM
jgi:hypothetical protein